MSQRFLTALPVYNEVGHVSDVLAQVRRYSPEVLVVDDGSTDGTSELLAREPGLHIVRHPQNQGYGAALQTAFTYAQEHQFEVLVTIDCDGQHEPRRIPRFVAACAGWDLISGSRYLKQYPGASVPPAERRRINEQLTAEINRRLFLNLTDAFCGFKAYRVEALQRLKLTEKGYAMPLELWVQAAHAGLRVRELPVPLIYLDEERSFGGSLDNAARRLEYYHLVLDRSLAAVGRPSGTALGRDALRRSNLRLLAVRPTALATLSLLESRPLQTPREHGEVLIDPPLREAGQWLAGSSDIGGVDYDLQGRSLAELASDARQQLVREAIRYTATYRDVPEVRTDQPIVLAGHQPQWFHAGVWFKNFVLGGLARQHHAVAINLAIDSDTLKEPAIRVPVGSLDSPHVHREAFDAPAAEIPFEERRLLDRPTFESFGKRVSQTMRPFVPDPVLDELWPLALKRSQHTDNLGECLAQSRHQLEGQWGLSTLELPQSKVCQLPAFAWFLAHILDHLPKFRTEYNRAVAEYRRSHRVRSANHPVPDLLADGPWLEAPFWIWTADLPRRRRLFARRAGNEMVLTDRELWEARLPLTSNGLAESAVEMLLSLAQQGVKIRTRALLTTLFARLFLGDIFIHGIGGGKYDQVTDLLIERFFGIQPPPYLVVSATLRLPVVRAKVTADDARGLDGKLRDLTYHPERFVDGESQAPLGNPAPWLEQKRHWVAVEPTRDNARPRCRAIRKANQALQPWVEYQRREMLAERARLNEELRAAEVWSSREFAFCLHSSRDLRGFMLEFVSATS